MKNEKEHSNNFTFILKQENILLCSKTFSADQFNPFTRYSIDIRDILPRAITKIQKMLSRKKYETQLSDDIDLYKYHQKIINDYPYYCRSEMKYKPKSVTYNIDNKIIRGVECKIGFYINNNPIVERVFYVDGFNPVSRWSVDVMDTVTDITDTIFESIKTNDIKNMWDDYYLINKLGLSINRIRDLSNSKRRELLRTIRFK